MAGEMRISEAAQLAGVSTRTLRYYEELGIITPDSHTPGGERRYSRDSIIELQRIRELKELLGFNLDEIRDVIAAERRLESLRDQYHLAKSTPSPGSNDERKAILAEALDLNERLMKAVDAKMASIDAFREHLDSMASRCRELLNEFPASAS